MKQISFVIPVYRNKESLRTTHERISTAVGEELPEICFSFIFVDDGSDDGSLDELLWIRDNKPNVEVITFSRNFGQVPAMISGLRSSANTGASIMLSADLQDPVEIIIEMIKYWLSGTEIVIAHRESREDSFSSSLTSKIFYSLIKLSNPLMPSGGFDFVLVDQKPRKVLCDLNEHNRFIQGDILWLGFSTRFIPYTRLKRPHGKSQWNLFKKVKYFIDGFLSTSYISIRLMSLLGAITASAGFLYALLIIYLKLAFNISPEGLAPIMVLLLVIGGIIMLMLGIIGEYIWRIYDETRNRPLYVIKEHYRSTEEKN
ncbi:MAG TPA: glycosyltransferase [Oligoflexia bacterium]|nr:glycosyltransferase [Oligoflexia bacterium]HMP48946.1 glycosyltransferase [Oligoflexia bacterium]